MDDIQKKTVIYGLFQLQCTDVSELLPKLSGWTAKKPAFAAAYEAREACVITQPLGRPLDPLVKHTCETCQKNKK